MAKSNNFILPLFLAIVLSILYCLYKSKMKETFISHSWLNQSGFHSVMDEIPSQCSMDSQCDTNKCLGNGYCAV
jgi:hypothetical protein